MCNFKIHLKEKFALLLKSSAALTMSCHQEFAIEKQVLELLTSWYEFNNGCGLFILPIGWHQFLGFFLFSDLMMSMKRKPEKFLGFECIFTGKIFNILVQRI